jgi:hypothetical protein
MGCCLAAALDAEVVPGLVVRAGTSMGRKALIATATMAGRR